MDGLLQRIWVYRLHEAGCAADGCLHRCLSPRPSRDWPESFAAALRSVAFEAELALTGKVRVIDVSLETSELDSARPVCAAAGLRAPVAGLTRVAFEPR